MDRINEKVEDYFKALNQLQKAIDQPKNEFTRDSVIMRFEFTYEFSWKMLKIILEKEGIIVQTPRHTFQEAFQAGFINDGNAWTRIQQHRNLTTHTYDAALAEDVYEFICLEGLKLFQELVASIITWKQHK